MKKNKVGITTQIRQADSIAKVEVLLAELKTYTYAHPSTIRKGERLAEKRIAQLTSI